jgi:hypothetical protein
MPLTNPRQALVTSKFWHDEGRPTASCTDTAVAGSRYWRLTEVLTMSPKDAGSTPLSEIAFSAAIAAPSTKETPSGHQRRARIPASRSRSPGRSPTRA